MIVGDQTLFGLDGLEFVREVQKWSVVTFLFSLVLPRHPVTTVTFVTAFKEESPPRRRPEEVTKKSAFLKQAFKHICGRHASEKW